MKNYLTLNIWVKSHSITLTVYCLSKAFPREEILQLRRMLGAFIQKLKA